MLFVQGTDPADVVLTRIQEGPKVLGINELFYLDLVRGLPKLAPHAVQHFFREKSAPGILFNVGVVEDDVLTLVPAMHVFSLQVSRRAMGQVAAGLLFQFQPRVDILVEEAHAGFLKVVDLVHVGQAVPLVQGLLQLQGTPRAGQRLGLVPMMAGIHRFGMHGGVDGLVHVGGAEREGQFTATPVRQHRMEQVSGQDHGTADQAKVLPGHHVFELELGDDLRMAHGIPTVLVDIGVKTLEVVIVHLFPLLDFVVQLVGVGPPAKEGVPRVQGLREAMLLEELSNGGVGLALAFPLVFPDRLDEVAVFAEQAMFSSRARNTSSMVLPRWR